MTLKVSKQEDKKFEICRNQNSDFLLFSLEIRYIDICFTLFGFFYTWTLEHRRQRILLKVYIGQTDHPCELKNPVIRVVGIQITDRELKSL